MPYRVSCGPSVGRAITVAHSAREALSIVRVFEDERRQNIAVSHLGEGDLSIQELERRAASETPRAPENS